MRIAEEHMPTLGVTPVLDALGLSVATHYRRQARSHASPSDQPARSSHRALSDEETQAVLQVLHEPRFVDMAPGEVYATLLDEGRYIASERTMYRILEANQEVKERRNQLRHPKYAKPELLATGPNQVWSWDITKLRTTVKWVYLYLYVILDIFSRYVVGWMVAEHENAQLARHLVEETYRKHDIDPGELILHADRGAPMKSKTLAQLLADLDVGRSFNRPHVSNDNPFSESAFKTLKYRPDFPKRFGGLHDALGHCRSFFPWYNDAHRHSGIAYLTPADVHFGRADEVLRRRHEVLLRAYQQHPERFARGVPRLQKLPPAVWINPPADVERLTTATEGAES